MAPFGDRPLAGPGSELQLTIDERAVPHAEVLAGEPVLGRAPTREVLEGVGEASTVVNLYAAGERLAARAATPATRRQYAAIYRSLADWLRSELGRPPLAGDVDSDAIAAGVKVPRHRAGPPETLTDLEYQNLLRVPDRRAQAGKRDHALLRVLGDCGLRSAELRQLEARDLRSPRSNARHRRLYVRGKGGTEREVPIPEQTLAALEAWLAVHPLARGRGLRDEQPLFVHLGRHPGSEPPEPLSAPAMHKLVRRYGMAAGVAERLCHPHALRAYWATTLLDDGVPIHHVSDRLGHADLRTTGRYAAVRVGQVDDVADVLGRRHQEHRRMRRGTQE